MCKGLLIVLVVAMIDLCSVGNILLSGQGYIHHSVGVQEVELLGPSSPEHGPLVGETSWMPPGYQAWPGEKEAFRSYARDGALDEGARMKAEMELEISERQAEIQRLEEQVRHLKELLRMQDSNKQNERGGVGLNKSIPLPLVPVN